MRRRLIISMQSCTICALALCALSLAACSTASIKLARVFGTPRHPLAQAAVQRLLSDDQLLQKEAYVELVALKEGAMPDLREMFEPATSEQRIRMLEVVSQIGAPPELLVEVFTTASTDPSPAVRQTLAYRCADHKNLESSLAPLLMKLIWDTSPMVQVAAITTLQEYSARERIPAASLKTLLTHSDPLVVASAATLALSRSEPELKTAARAALPTLVGQLNNTSPLVRANVIIAIGKYGPVAGPATSPLSLVMLRDQNPAIRLQCAIALARIHTKKSLEVALPALQQFASSPDAALAIPAQKILAELPQTNRPTPIATPLAGQV